MTRLLLTPLLTEAHVSARALLVAASRYVDLDHRLRLDVGLLGEARAEAPARMTVFMAAYYDGA
jgi:hypothetical protein